MKYKTRGNSNPQGKPRVYFTGHPADVKLYFESITDTILKLHDCAVFYDEDPEHPEDAENFVSDLDRMQLIVLVVTSRYVYGDTFAHNTVFQHAMERHIPVLPILEERDIERDFNKKCGDLQYLDPNAKDDTAISFEEKLKKFLLSVLVGDELAAKVRAAFDAYIFLSYRKKDRRYAQQLMRLIHQDLFCRDIAIWYDEFLVPGEDFNDAIRKAMEKSELFALVVTPSLLEDHNYIMSTEYPAAREADMPILPAMLVPTDDGELAARYENIPKPIDPTQNEVLSAALHAALVSVTASENDDETQHIFFIGLAYLSGIDVEVNHELAVQLITRAAEAGLPEAIEKLVSMYRTGEGVARNYHKAIHWQERMVEARHAAFKVAPAEKRGRQWFNALLHLGDFWYELRQLAQAGKVYQDMLEAGQILSEDYHAERFLSISYNKLGKISQAQGDLADAKAFYEKSLAISERLEAEAGTVEARRNLSISYNNLGDISRAQGNLAGATALYKKGLAISEQLALETGTVEARRDLFVSYIKLGDVCHAQRNLAARANLVMSLRKKGPASRERLGLYTGTVQAWQGLPASHDRLSEIIREQENLAKTFHEKGLASRKQLGPDTGAVQARLNEIIREQENLAKTFHEKGLASRKQLGPDTGAVQARLNEIIREQENLAKIFHEKSLASRKQPGLDTGAVQARQGLSASHHKLSEIGHAQEYLARAKAFYKKGFAICERLALETDTVEARRDLSISYDRLGNVCRAQGDFAKAKALYKKGFAICERLAAETDTVEARRNLSISYNNLGYIIQEQGDLTGAKAFYEKSLAIRERLAAETDTVEAQQDLYVSYEWLGSISRTQGDLVGAKAFYEKGLAIRERLAPKMGTVEAQWDLYDSYGTLGDISRAQGDSAGAKAFYKKGIAIREQLAAKLKQ